MGENPACTNAHYVNWDDDEDACDCYDSVEGHSTDWNANGPSGSVGVKGGKCCGDDLTSDGGYLTTNQKDVCAQTTGGDYYWFNTAERAGDIFYIDYGTYDVKDKFIKQVS